MPLGSPPLAQTFCDHRGDERVQTNAFLTGLGYQPRVQAPGHALPPLSTRRSRTWNRVTVLKAIHEVRLDRVRAVFQCFFRSFPIGDAPRQVRIFDSKSATVRFGEWANREWVGVNEGLVNFHYSYLRCRRILQTNERTLV